MKTLFVLLTASLALVGLLASSIYNYLALPIVAIDSAGRCAYIENEGRRINCESMPKKYIKIYVK